MVLGAYEEHVLGPRRKAVRKADEAERKLEEARAWNKRRLKAQADGKPFDEPYPITDADLES
ncbi:MAG: hypothetical protein OXD31_19130 [Chloroflexi bacterium]|nr:hypothetical protein [Chloroflexota bacterium]